MKGRDKVSIKP